MGTRNSGDVRSHAPLSTLASAQVTTSGGVVIMSVNTTGAAEFALTNFGSIPVFVRGSFDGEFFVESVAMTNPATSTSTNVALASTGNLFAGPYVIVRVVANSGSGVYRANLNFR